LIIGSKELIPVICAAVLTLSGCHWNTVAPPARYDTAFQWAFQIGGSGDDRIAGIAVDGDGNPYVTGYFAETISLGTGAARQTLASAGGEDIFVAKLNTAGELLWAMRIGGPEDDRTNAIAVDAEGNVAVTGRFSDTLSFGGASSSDALKTSTYYDAFVAGLSPEGNLRWAHQMGGNVYSEGKDIAVDANGGIHVTGVLRGPLEQGVGFGANLQARDQPGVGCFVVKLESNGVAQWGKAVYGVDTCEGTGISVDGAGNVYVAGPFNHEVDFDPGLAEFLLKVPAFPRNFLMKLNTNGGFVWAKRLFNDTLNFGGPVAVDRNGALYFSGQTGRKIVLDPEREETILRPADADSRFVAKFDQDGKVQWDQILLGSFTLDLDLAVDQDGVCHVGGMYSGALRLEEQPTPFDLPAPDALFGGYLIAIDPLGRPLFSRSFRSMTDERTAVAAVAADTQGNLYAAGHFAGAMDADPDAGSFPLQSAGGPDSFVTKLAYKKMPED
jgi:hypothetical protein